MVTWSTNSSLPFVVEVTLHVLLLFLFLVFHRSTYISYVRAFVKQLIQELHENKHIDDMAKKWLFQTGFKHLARLEFQFSRLEEFQKHLRVREDIHRINNFNSL